MGDQGEINREAAPVPEGHFLRVAKQLKESILTQERKRRNGGEELAEVTVCGDPGL